MKYAPEDVWGMEEELSWDIKPPHLSFVTVIDKAGWTQNGEIGMCGVKVSNVIYVNSISCHVHKKQ